MNGALWASQLGKGLHDVFLEGTKINKIRAGLHRGGIFEKTRCFVIFNDDVHVGMNEGGGLHAQKGAINQRLIRTVSAVVNGNTLTSNKGCSDKLMSYTNEGEKGHERSLAQVC
jgi:hypothetical protein